MGQVLLERDKCKNLCTKFTLIFGCSLRNTHSNMISDFLERVHHLEAERSRYLKFCLLLGRQSSMLPSYLLIKSENLFSETMRESRCSVTHYSYIHFKTSTVNSIFVNLNKKMHNAWTDRESHHRNRYYKEHKWRI